MKGRHFTTAEFEEWGEWYDRLPEGGPYHAPAYLEMLAGEFEFEEERAELFVYGDEDTFVYYPYLRRDLSNVPVADDALEDPSEYSDIVSSWYYGGPLTSADADAAPIAEFFEAFGDHCESENIVAEFVRFDPNLENHEEFTLLDPSFNRETVPVDLTQSKEEIWEGYEGRNQRAITQARDSALEIDRSYTAEDVEKFHAIYSNAMEARDADDHYRFTRSFFDELLASPYFTLLVARYEDEVVGGFLIAHDDVYSHHYLSASNPDYWEYRVNNLLYHEVVMYMHDTDRELFDFQGGRPGVFKFKKGFSPDRCEFHIAKRTHVPDVYEDLVDAAEDAGVDTNTGYFPAYRIEQSN